VPHPPVAAVASVSLEQPTLDQPPLDEAPAAEPGADEAGADEPDTDQQRRTLWQTAWGVVLAASGAFSLGYGASRSADPSVGASRPPAWPLFISVLVVVVAIWFVLAPRLHRWPFDETPTDDAAGGEPWLTELTETDDPDDAPLAAFQVETPSEHEGTSPPSP
jgi:hypothetical protein